MGASGSRKTARRGKMEHGVTREVKKFRDLNELSEAVAADVAVLISKTVSKEGHFSLVLSGGSTPRTLHRLLGTVYREKIPWEAVSIYFGDERYVPHTDKQSNYLMAKETLLNLIPIPAGKVHPIPTDVADPARAAEAYDEDLREHFSEKGKSFDLVILGIGNEGHTASLFPDSPALDELRRWAVFIEVPAVPHERITLTYPILNRASSIYFLVSGSDKKDALSKVQNENFDYHTCPAKGINPDHGKLVWWVDSDAIGG